MKHVAIKHIALFAALVVSSATNAATYDYTEHYVDIRKPSLTNAQIDAQIQMDTITCDNAVGVQHARPSAPYRSCMLQHGWKFSSLTRTRVQARAPADPYSVRTPKWLPAISSITTTAWTARTRAAPRFAIPRTARCTISIRIRTCPARAPARCPFARTCEHGRPRRTDQFLHRSAGRTPPGLRSRRHVAISSDPCAGPASNHGEPGRYQGKADREQALLNRPDFE